MCDVARLAMLWQATPEWKERQANRLFEMTDTWNHHLPTVELRANDEAESAAESGLPWPRFSAKGQGDGAGAAGGRSARRVAQRRLLFAAAACHSHDWLLGAACQYRLPPPAVRCVRAGAAPIEDVHVADAPRAADWKEGRSSDQGDGECVRRGA